ncbi:MAG: sensor domain-containing protein, partial [Burkholderiaceae bacterium]
DERIAAVLPVAEELHRRIASGDTADKRLRPLIDQVNDTNLQLTPLEDAFALTLGEASRKTEVLIFSTLLLLAATLAVLAAALSRRMSIRNEKVEHALRLSEERLTLAVNGSNDGLWDWDMVTGASYYSPHVNQLLGYGPGEFEQRNDAFIEILHPEDAALSRTAMQAHLRHNAPYDMELRLRRKNGAYRWFLSRGQCVRDAQGRAVRMAGSLKDIHDRKLAEAAVSHHAMQQGLLAAFGQLALSNPEIDELMAQAVHIVGRGLDGEFCRLLAAGPDEGTLVLKGASGWDAQWSTRLTYDTVEETEGHFIVGVREAIVIDDFFRCETRFQASAVLLAHDVRSGAEMLIRGAHSSHAVLGIYSREVARFAQESIHFLQGISNTLASAMDRKVTDERLTYMAQFDALTSLPNRSLYLDRLSQTITQAGRDGSPIGVLFVDLDRFKMVNDTLGHGAGDEVLLQVAQRLQTCVRPGDTVGRLGGDEFAIALANLARAEDAGAVAQKIGEALLKPFDVNGHQVYVSASLGISIYPIDGSDPDTLLKNADTAMYRAKESGRNSYQYYLAQMNRRAIERLKIETQLRGALQRNEFLLHYQPKVNLGTGEISGFEALLRWQHPERGLVAPADFISILEDTGLIIPVGEWVLTTVCEQLVRWRHQGLSLRPVAVNLSARQFNQKHLDATIGDIIRASGVEPDLLEFELTESMLMSDSEAAVRTLKNIKSLGVRLSVDDFGTGYSSLAYLKRFPLDSLKIDRAFIRDVTTDADDATIAAAIINLAHSLKMNVVAEGVETEAQLNFLRKHACDEMQGYYFARPMPAAECTRALQEGWRMKGHAVATRVIGRSVALVSATGSFLPEVPAASRAPPVPEIAAALPDRGRCSR